MTEQELRHELGEAIKASGIPEGQTAFDLKQKIQIIAKAYAGAREAKANNKIAEIRRLCKAFLYDLPCSHNVAVIGDFLDAYADNKILDEFKKTVVAAKDAEIAELKAELKWAKEQNDGLKTDMQHSRLIEAAQVKESRDLKDENERLRAFAESCHKSPEKLVVIHYFENGEFDYQDLVPLQDAAANALSPAPVTEGREVYSTENYPKITLEQLIENDDLTMMQRLEKRMPPFHKIDSPANQGQQ